MTDANRRRLTTLVAAGTKLDAASRLAKEATVDVAASGLFPVKVREEVIKIATEIDALVARLMLVTARIPS